MKKSTQFIVASFLAGAGIVLLAIDKFSASADELNSYAQSFNALTIPGLVLTIGAAVWFYYLTIRS